MDINSSKALTLARSVTHESLNLNDADRAYAILDVMNIVEDYNWLFGLECSADLAMNMQRGCDHLGNEFCDGSDLNV